MPYSSDVIIDMLLNPITRLILDLSNRPLRSPDTDNYLLPRRLNLHPHRIKSAAERHLPGTNVRQTGSVKRNGPSSENLIFQQLYKHRRNALTSPLWQHINSNLPEQLCIRRATRQTDHLPPVHCPCRQHVRPLRFEAIAQRVRELVPSAQGLNILLFEPLHGKGCVNLLHPCLRQKHMMTLSQPLSVL